MFVRLAVPVGDCEELAVSLDVADGSRLFVAVDVRVAGGLTDADEPAALERVIEAVVGAADADGVREAESVRGGVLLGVGMK